MDEFKSRSGYLVVGTAVIAIGIVILWALWPLFVTELAPPERLATVAPPQPLQAITRTSQVIAPVAIALTAIGQSLDAASPRDFSGKSNSPVTQLLSQAEIGLSVTRGTMSASGQPGVLTVTTPLNGKLRIAGQIGHAAGLAVGGLGSSLGGLLGGSDLGTQIGGIASKALDQSADFRASVVLTSRPQLTSAWRLEPNLAGHLNFPDTRGKVAGISMNLGSEVRPLLEPAINTQVGALQSRLRSDPIIERTAREQWLKMCRSIPLGGEKTGLPPLWLEMRPIRAAAAQPLIDSRNVTLTIGVQAETRVVPNETKPNCPFPAELELVPPMQEGVLAVDVPIDVPFVEINKMLEPQLKRRRFPEDGSGAVNVEVLRASLAASGDRLLITLRLKVREKKSWFGFGTEATVHVWGKPQLDQQNQMLRLSDLSVAVESEAAFGLLGAAARAAIPHIQTALADSTQLDLKPFAADAKAKIAAALSEFQQVSNGVQVDVSVNALRLTGIEFDAHTLRVIAQASGNVGIAVSQLPK
jgi:hypothetical protein